jgi:hypothetical protein
MDVRREAREIFPVNEIVLQNVKEQEENLIVFNETDPEPSEVSIFISYSVGAAFEYTRVVYPSSSFTFVVPDWAEDWIRFDELATKWKKTRTPWRSFSGDLMRDPNYSQIVGMGPAAIKFILWELQAEIDSGKVTDWFYALWAITDENPIPPEAQGKPIEAAKAWIEWGKRKGLIYDATLGGILSATW